MAERKATILYIEDDPATQLLVRRTLAYAGYTVFVAARALEGLDLASKERVDLVLVDMNLPDMTGREVTTRLRADSRYANLPIVALTAQNQQGDREMAFVAGLSGYLTKPMDIQSLPASIEFYLRGGTDPVDESMLRDAQTAYSREVVLRLEEKLRELESSNTELRRMDQVKDDFVQLTAHELRTPLSITTGYSRLLQETEPVAALCEQNADVAMLFNGLIESIERMSRVVNEIMTVSRIASDRFDLTLSSVYLGSVVCEALDEFDTALQSRGQKIEFDVTGWPQVQADRELLTLTLHNLLSNAIKYTPDHGRIAITHTQTTDGVTIAISDSGIGISKEDQNRIFSRFTSIQETRFHSTSKTKYRGGGLGIGLSICRSIVEAHGGRLWVESPGFDEKALPGSIFSFYLPVEAHRRLSRIAP